MNKIDMVEFIIEVSVTDATKGDIDRLTRQLLFELRALDVESAELIKSADALIGTKSGEPVMMGNIAIAVLPSILPKVVEFLQAWAMRGHGRAVKFKGKIAGQVIEFEGSAEDLQNFLKHFQRVKGKNDFEVRPDHREYGIHRPRPGTIDRARQGR